jgi:RNA recognition motif-containing protein
LRWYFPRKDSAAMNYGKHRGFGFIYFKTREAQLNALRMQDNPPVIGRRQLKINDNTGFLEQRNHSKFDPKLKLNKAKQKMVSKD